MESVSPVIPCCTAATPHDDSAPLQYASAVDAVMPLCAGVGNRCGFESLPLPTVIAPPEHAPTLCRSASITQSAFPAISALVASNNTLCGGIARALTQHVALTPYAASVRMIKVMDPPRYRMPYSARNANKAF